MNRIKTLALLPLLALGACHTPTDDDFANRGDPESLLTVSSEVVNIDLTEANVLDNLSDRLAQDPPTRAIINCTTDDKRCARARHILDKWHVATKDGTSGEGITLIYERTMARDCENRYIDNSSNPYNLNYSSFGCSVKANSVQMVTDKHQFTKPNLLSFQDGEKVGQTYDHYLNPPADAKPSTGSVLNANGTQ